MKKNRQLFLLLFLFVFPLLAAFGQNDACHKYVPYFRSLNAKKLAVRLTGHLGSDSAKVCAIHDWITHNIKYDYKAYAAADYRVVPVKKILSSRKAICTGYSQLFNELCRYSNIISVAVPGYTRNFDTDLHDRFYMEDHQWNAVYINKQWLLVDACYDAGYVKFFKRTFKGHVLHAATRGRKSESRFKPHFVRQPSHTYYCKTGLQFSTDHVPSDPLWQLLSPAGNLQEAENDSSFYLGRFNREAPRVEEHTLDYERMRIKEMNGRDKEIYDGFAAFRFNPKNQYGVARSFYLLAENDYVLTNFKLKDTAILKKQCDSLMIKLVMSVNYYDSNAFFINRQKQELQARNTTKRQINTFEHAALVETTNRSLRYIRTGKGISKRLKVARKKIIKLGEQNKKRLMENPAFAKTKTATRPRPADSAACVSVIALYKDSLEMLNRAMEMHLKHAYELFDTCSRRLADYSRASARSTEITGSLIGLRMDYEDDLDYLVRTTRHPLMLNKFAGDSLLLGATGSFILRDFYTSVLQLKAGYVSMYKFHRKIADQYVKLKRCSMQPGDLNTQYEANIALYAKRLAIYTVFLVDLAPGPAQFKTLCRDALAVAEKERHNYYIEKDIESALYRARAKHIGNRYRSLSGLNRTGKSASLKMYHKVQRVRERITKG